MKKQKTQASQIMLTDKEILDAACGSRMFWFDKENPRALFLDNRTVEDVLCDGRHFEVKPDVIADFTSLPFPNDTFYLVVFDPPHLQQAGDKSWLVRKYGKLPKDWQALLSAGFRECLRVLKPHGILNFKWNEQQIPIRAVLECCPLPPLYGTRVKAGGTIWITFMKEEGVIL